MKKESFSKYIFTKEITFNDELNVTLRELTTKEMMLFKNSRNVKDKQEQELKLIEFLEENLPKFIVKHSVEDATNAEVAVLLIQNMDFFNIFIVEFSDFLAKRQQKKE